MASSGVQEGYVQASRAAEDSQTEVYSKRKAGQHPKSGLPKGYQDSKEHSRAVPENSGDFPQKKQKLVSSQCQCGIHGVYREEYDP
jgi:hypothetical protein